jgi:hypothetical protein
MASALRASEPQNLAYPLNQVQSTLTAPDRFFVRDHFAEPELSLESWKLRIEGRVARPYELNLSDLLEMPARKVEAVLECAGNVAGGAAASNGIWYGVPIAVLLKSAKPQPGSAFVLLEGADTGKLLQDSPALLSTSPAQQVSGRFKFDCFQVERPLSAWTQWLSRTRLVPWLVWNGFGQVAAPHRGCGGRRPEIHFSSERNGPAVQSGASHGFRHAYHPADFHTGQISDRLAYRCDKAARRTASRMGICLERKWSDSGRRGYKRRRQTMEPCKIAVEG